MTTPDARPPAQVREPLVYAPESRESFFRDIILSQVQRDPAAADRLARHRAQMADQRAERDRAAATEFGVVLSTLEGRANPSSALGAGGEFDVPLSMLDKFASGARAGRALADLVGSTLLPPGISSIHIPRMTTGTQTTAQIDTEASASQDIVTTDIVSPVVTIAGHLDVSQQIFDQAPLGFDTYAFSDLNRAYNKNLDAGILNGSGQNGQILGIANTPGANIINGSTTTTFTALWPQLGQAGAAVGNTRFLPPQAWLLAPRRWFWIASSLDTASRPISTPGNGAPQPTKLLAAGGAAPVGPILGLPAYMDGAISAGVNADSVYCVRPDDMYLFEGPPRIIAAANPTSGTLQIRLSLHRYVAFVGARYPAGIGIVQNLPAPAGF